MWDLSHWDRMFSDSFGFPLSLSFHHYFIFFFVLNRHLAGRQNGRSLATLQQCHAVSEIVEHHGGKVHSLLLQRPMYYIIIVIWINYRVSIKSFPDYKHLLTIYRVSIKSFSDY